MYTQCEWQPLQYRTVAAYVLSQCYAASSQCDITMFRLPIRIYTPLWSYPLSQPETAVSLNPTVIDPSSLSHNICFIEQLYPTIVKMASRFGTFVTGPRPKASGNNTITLHVRLRDNAPKHGTGTIMYENLDEGILTSTSKLLWQKRGDHIWLVWKEIPIVGAYMNWLNERILYRPSMDGPARPSDWTLFKYPKGKLGELSPLLRDMHTLLNMWLLGAYLQDITFMDTVMSTLQLLLEEAHEPEYDDGQETPKEFLRLLKPSVINAIWAKTNPDAKLRKFIIDYIMKYSPHLQLSYFNGSITDRNDNGVAAAPSTPKKAAHGHGTFDSPVRSSPRRSTFALSSSESEHNTNKKDATPDSYPADFVTELNEAHRGTLLVSQLPEHIRAHYPGQVRVYLPPFPYILPHPPTLPLFTLYGVEEQPVVHYPHTIVSQFELQGPARSAFFNAVYGTGQTILRSAYWNTERDAITDLEAANNNGADVEMGDAHADEPEVKMSCVYHQHTQDRACWLLKNPLVNGGAWPTGVLY